MAEKITTIIKDKIKSKFPDLFSGFYNSEKVAGLLLVFCTLFSLGLTNSGFADGYSRLTNAHVDLSFAGIGLDLSIEHWINDGLMAIFFLMVGLEVERELYVGELAEFKKAILPLAAAIGGICLPSLIHFFLNKGTPTQPGFAIPMATDIAFALGILALAGDRVPIAVKIFLTALAIIDDIGAILVIAIFYTKTVLFGYLLVALGILAIFFVVRKRKIRSLWVYLLPGLVVWYCFLKSGVHATIAGVLLAFVIPFRDNKDESISHHLLHILHKPVAFFIIPVFALANTAIVFPPNILQSLSASNSIGIMVGLVVGKLAGIFLFPFVLVKTGLAKLQKGVTWKNLVGIGLLGGIGFTMSMFISNLAFDDKLLVSSSKLSILIASTISAVCGFVLLRTNKPIIKS